MTIAAMIKQLQDLEKREPDTEIDCFFFVLRGRGFNFCTSSHSHEELLKYIPRHLANPGETEQKP